MKNSTLAKGHALTLLLFLVAVSSVQSAEAGDEDADSDLVILERQLDMQQLDKDTKAMGAILAGLQPADGLATRARAIARGAKEARASFQPRVPGGSAKPGVWTQYGEFSKLMDQFATNTEQLVGIAETGNLAVAGEAAISALTCKQCHDRYREPEE